jgi:hypothetical protein
MTVLPLLERWLADLGADRAARTIQRYGGAVRHFLAWHADHEGRPLALPDLTPIALVGYRATLQQTAAARTVNTHVCGMRQNLDTTHSPVTLWAALFTPALLSDSGYFGHDRRPPVLEHAPTIRE